jgi:hypothetical protein
MAGLVHLIAYSDGEVRQEFTFVYAAEIQSGELKIHHESEEASWIPVGSAVELPLAESQRRRSRILAYQKDRQTFLRYSGLLIPLALERRIPMGTADPNGI